MTAALPVPISRSFISQRLRLNYTDWGNTDKPPLLLVHGGRDHSRTWDWVAERLRYDWHVMAPDLRGHGDSQWSPDGAYNAAGYIYDLAQLIHQQALAPVTIVGHSLGGNISLRYTGIYPEAVRKLVVIEGLGPSPKALAEQAKVSVAERMDKWIQEQRDLAARQPRRYASIAEAHQRMQAQNPRLTPAQTLHLTEHGLRQNEDGSYSWKFDDYVRAFWPYDIPLADDHALWARITCPTLLVYGKDSWASNPAQDGRAQHFKNARVELVEGAGHWVQHDRLDHFCALLQDFL